MTPSFVGEKLILSLIEKYHNFTEKDSYYCLQSLLNLTKMTHFLSCLFQFQPSSYILLLLFSYPRVMSITLK